MLKKQKLLLIIIVLSIILNMSFATFAVENEDYDIPNDGYYYWIIYKTKSEKTYLHKSISTFDVSIYSSSDKRYNIYNAYVRYELSSGNWVLEYDGSSHTGRSSGGFNKILASNHNIYIKDSDPAEVFFSVPTVSPLMESMMKADSGMILKTISHGLILVSGCLISAICFRKAWGFLRNQFQH